MRNMHSSTDPFKLRNQNKTAIENLKSHDLDQRQSISFNETE